ncbi:tetratricopeptide repeat protein [Brucella anthropi]|uniref:tetratricopeptide repeat protein n=1 Tax=Brucella anthropi TaxID=529 RepID=UPI00384D146F
MMNGVLDKNMVFFSGCWGLWVRKSVCLVIVFVLSSCASSNSSSTSILSEVETGEEFLAKSQYEMAYATLDEVARNNPASSTAAIALAEAYFRHGAVLKAELYYRKAIDLGETDGGTYGLARLELARNRPKLALNYLLQKNSKEPRNIDVLNAIGVAYDLNDQHELAQNYFREVLSISPFDKKANNNLSLSMALNGNAVDAQARIEELFRSNRNDKVIRQNFALVLFLVGCTDKARRVAELDLTNKEVQNNFTELDKRFNRATKTCQ